MSKKRVGALLLSLLTVFSVVGCTPINAEDSTSNGSATAETTQTKAESLGEYSFIAVAQTDEQTATQTDTYFTLPASRDNSVRIPVGVTMPALGKGESCPVVVLVHGFLGSKDEEFGFFANATQENYQYESMASQLLSLGIGTIRIDQPGSGESQDDFRNYTLENSVSDLQDAYDYCMKNFAFDAEKVGVVGWSMGGKVGPKFISQNSNISAMVLLNPAADNGNNSLLTASAAGLDWEVLEKTAFADGEVENETASEFAGRKLVMSKAFFEQVDDSKTGDEIIRFLKDGGSGWMIYGDKDSVINPTTYQWIDENTDMEVVCIPGMDHDLGLESGRPDFTRTVLDLTVSALYRALTN